MATLLIHILLYILNLHSISSQLQINLYLTNWKSGDEKYDGLLHHCLYATSAVTDDREPYQIIPYCLSEWPSTWNIQDNHIDSKFTFVQLASESITSEQLYLWSAPMDIIQRYQNYLDSLSDLTLESMGKEIFYNCTLPNFGPSCEYSLLAYKSHQSSLDQIVRAYYRTNPYEPTSLTCYMHLQCDRGSPAVCLDWTEICDGKVDCFDGGRDEEHCWQMEINQCNENEFRCLDGQCIPMAFLREVEFHFDCLDLYDDSLFDDMLPSFETKFSGEPTFGYEDVSCAKIGNFLLSHISSSCVEKRDELLFDILFSIKPISIKSDECWKAFKCIIHMPVSNEEFCREFCTDGRCDDIVTKSCPNIIYTTARPILLTHIFIVYENKALRYTDSDTDIPKPTYVCYNGTLLHLPANEETFILLDNMTCRFHQDSIVNDDRYKPGWIKSHIDPLYRWLRIWSSSIYNDSKLCDEYNLYRCIDSHKCVSKHRLLDRIQDCYHKDDEDVSVLNRNCSTQQSPNYFKCETTNECIPLRLVRDGKCHCTPNQIFGQYTKCDDENRAGQDFRSQIIFPFICDHMTHLYPKLIDGRNQTDETDCEHWPCNNIYTRCNKWWNCPNGADELNCSPSPVLNCSSDSHICGSFKTNELICLPIEKANDGVVDCIGATDEPNICRLGERVGVDGTFHCLNSSRRSCIRWYQICDGIPHCKNGEDEHICSSISDAEPNTWFCQSSTTDAVFDPQDVFCSPFYKADVTVIIHSYFKLEETPRLHTTKAAGKISHIQSLQSTAETKSHRQRCHRGLDLQVWLNKKSNLTELVCLCPPSFYGNQCQFQNQRISVTVQFLVSSDSIEIPIIIVFSLMDNSSQQIIHSNEQITYLSKKYCRKKFNFYLLYSTRPKDANKEYFIHIDIYERETLTHRGSMIKTILFAFLPVYRLSFQMNVPSIFDKPENCLDSQCINGKCIKYFDDLNVRTFCQCKPGWSGRHCDISYHCTCSSDSLCIGILQSNRSICVCPLQKMGGQCLLNNTFLCENDKKPICSNGGRCLIINEYRTIDKQVICICPKAFAGERCEKLQTKITVSFGNGISVPTAIYIHFITVNKNEMPQHTTNYKIIPFGQRSVTIYWSYEFHLMFIEWNQKYYLSILQKQHNLSAIIQRTLHPSDRCLHINELFNETILNLHILHRIKYYHLPCSSQPLACFYDETYLCICQYHYGQHISNCFEFAHNKTQRCLSRSDCMHGGDCLQDNLKCPTTSLCVCAKCYYGTQCQLSTYGFSLSLDAILGYHIQPKYGISDQSYLVILSVIITTIVIVVSLINVILSLITFKEKVTRQSDCGIYLLCSSIIILLTSVIFALKFSILLFSHIKLIQNQVFLKAQCYSIDFLLRFCLTMDQWLIACVSVERSFIVIKGLHFKKKKTRSLANWVIFVLLSIVIGTTIHDPIHRRLFIENNDEQNRIWCIVEYPTAMQLYNSIISISHLVLPFIINITSAILIITISTKQQVNLQKRRTFKRVLQEEIQKHRSFLTGPFVLTILGIPRLILTVVSGCMESSNHSWLFLLGYYISLIPTLLTFVLFILPSTIYKQAFDKAVREYKSTLRTWFTRVVHQS
ncbi:unnamed protein product [Adineta ricciae]|uniref:Uncharacterized protein n=1 Tax=Adineta ricciae TaxID=249248 RepID=A0A815SID4_ADIRI|nr:unnamed protein product [Adineta ricciae]